MVPKCIMVKIGGKQKRRKLNKKRKLNENRRKFINFQEIGGICIIGFRDGSPCIKLRVSDHSGFRFLIHTYIRSNLCGYITIHRYIHTYMLRYVPDVQCIGSNLMLY